MVDGMPATTKRQAAFMRWMAHDPDARAKRGISQKVARDFSYTEGDDDPPRRKPKRNALTEQTNA